MAESTAVLAFQNTTFEIIDWQGQPWLRSPQIAEALGYNQVNRVADLYSRNAAEFTPAMTEVIDLPTAGGVQPVRIFSLRGAHLLGMLARTERAAEFRRWVLDVLEGRVAPQQAGTMTYGQRLAYLRERRMLVKALADCRDAGQGRELHENLRQVSGLLRITPQALNVLAPALRQLPLPGQGAQ
jgi:prophage antirepressor-like protein